MNLKILYNSIIVRGEFIYLIFVLIFSSCNNKVSKNSGLLLKENNTENIDEFFNEVKNAVDKYDKKKMLKNFSFPLSYSENPNDPKSTYDIFFKDLDTSRNFGKYMLPYLEQIKGADKHYILNDSIIIYYNENAKDRFLQDDCLVNFYVLKKHNRLRLIKFESICD